MAQLQVELVAATGKIWEGTATQVSARGVEGDFGVMEGHAPFMTTLKDGALEIYKTAGGEPERVQVSGGFAEVGDKGLTVLAEKAEA